MSILPIKAALVFRTSTVLAVFVRVCFVGIEKIGSSFFLIVAWIDPDPWTSTPSVNTLYCAQPRAGANDICHTFIRYITAMKGDIAYMDDVKMMVIDDSLCCWSVSEYVGFSFFLLLFLEGKIGMRKSLPAIGQG